MTASTIRLPSSVADTVAATLERCVQRLAQAAGVETQELAVEGEAALVELAAARAVYEAKVRLWGPDAERPSMPAPGRASRAEMRIVPGETGG